MSTQEKPTKTVAIIGAGLVGSLASVYFAIHGYQVNIYDKRPDIRNKANADKLNKRSINLALSHRGISALKKSGLNLDKLILKNCIPMKGRMIHDLNGNQTSQAYGTEEQFINSVDRGLLNEKLLTEALNFDNVQVYFEYQLVSMDLDNTELKFKVNDNFEHVKADFIIGCDGAYSKIRQEMMKKVNLNYSQEYIEHVYCELTIPPQILEDNTKEYKMNPNHLHIWPRHSYMMIALPNLDKSFTCTLFGPKQQIDAIKTETQLFSLFSKDLADSIGLIGWNNLAKEYFQNPKGSLLSVKCSPHHYKEKCILLGDSAHCMVPFYGQGMNCGFEDVETLFSIMDEFDLHDKSLTSSEFCSKLEKVFNTYSETRVKDTHAICDLALYNYTEMRSSVTSYGYLIRKKVEAWLHKLIPDSVIPLYTMVSFSSIPYSQAIKKWKFQTKLLKWLGYVKSIIGLVTIKGIISR
ncbi:FAD/NAD(P)-binding domain-containing protein [Neoconidiobolus thromboides FSU 785]|nr:FAD/NAD(P)-binding domain-containing protein [Neoconidiobolus thromboides FSU 785]